MAQEPLRKTGVPAKHCNLESLICVRDAEIYDQIQDLYVFFSNPCILFPVPYYWAVCDLSRSALRNEDPASMILVFEFCNDWSGKHWAVLDLNQPPSVCETDALTNWANRPKGGYPPFLHLLFEKTTKTKRRPRIPPGSSDHMRTFISKFALTPKGISQLIKNHQFYYTLTLILSLKGEEVLGTPPMHPDTRYLMLDVFH